MINRLRKLFSASMVCGILAWASLASAQVPVRSNSQFTTVTVSSKVVAPAADNCANPPYTFSGDLDTGVCSSVDNTVSIRAGGSTRFTFTTGAINPTTDGSFDLGTSSLRYQFLFLGTSLNVGTNPSSTGAIRLANTGWIAARNAANSADVNIWSIDANNRIKSGGDVYLGTSNGLFGYDSGGSNTRQLISHSGDNMVVGNATQGQITIQAATSVFLTATSTEIGASNVLGWTGRAFLESPADGIFQARNAAETGFTRLVLGTNDTSGVSFVKSGTTIQASLGDGSAQTVFSALTYQRNGVVLVSGTAPTIASGGCTAPAVTWNNGTATFLITIGTSCTGVKTVTLTLPTASNAWKCDGDNNTTDAAQQTNYPTFRTTSATAVVLTSYDRVTGLQEDFTASDTYLVKCSGG